MKYYLYNYTQDNELNIKIGLIHFLLDVNKNAQGESFIPANFVRPFFQTQKWNLKSVYQVLFNTGFINKVVTKRGQQKYNYYKVYMIKHDLEEKKLPTWLEYKYNNYVHLLDPKESLPLQRVLNYTINIDFERLEYELSQWKHNKLVNQNIEKEITTQDLWLQIISHNEKVKNNEKTWIKDDYSGRIHHLLTRTPSFLRNFTQNGELEEFDIAQCQPTLLALIEERYNGVENEYSRLFYEEGFDIYKGLNPQNRELGKTEFYNAIFGFGENKKLSKLFPHFYLRLQDIRTKNPELIGISSDNISLKIKEDAIKRKYKVAVYPYYKATSLVCQLLEVEIFENIWKKLLKGKIWFIPVHDAIWGLEKDKEVILRIINDVFSEKFKDSKIKYKIK